MSYADNHIDLENFTLLCVLYDRSILFVLVKFIWFIKLELSTLSDFEVDEVYGVGDYGDDDDDGDIVGDVGDDGDARK